MLTLTATNMNMATAQFDHLHQKALMDGFINHFLHRQVFLLPYPGAAHATTARPTTTEIPIHQIVGTLSRVNDFDSQFRPLNAALRNRWAAMLLAFDQLADLPIRVCRVADAYYVVDGHHRVSVARYLRYGYINAVVG